MWKSLVVVFLSCLQYQANAQLFTRYAIGISGVVERGIRTPRASYYSTPMVFGGNIILLTEDSKERFFITAGMGFTNYVRNDLWIAPSQLNPILYQGTFIPKSSSRSDYSIQNLNVPINLGYKFITKKKLNVYAAVGVDLRFQISSKIRYVVKYSTEQIIYETTDTDSPYFRRLKLFAFSIGMEHKSASGRFIYRVEPFLKVDRRKFLKSEDTWLNQFLSYAGAQISCFYQLKIKK